MPKKPQHRTPHDRPREGSPEPSATMDTETITRDLRREIEVRKEMESRLLVAMEVAEAADTAKNEFLANVSHELRTPMTAIIASVQLLKDYVKEQHLRDILEIINTSSHAMMELINNLLDYAKSETGRVLLEDNVFDVQEAVIESMKPFEVRAKEQGLTLGHDVDLPQFDMVIGDIARLRQILGHLIDNALKFTEAGEINCRVRLTDPNGHGLSVEDGCDCFHFSVTDTGRGIPADQHRRVFEAFVRCDESSTPQQRGSGLGLAITQRLVEMMNGRIWLESDIGKGTTFHFIVQLRTATPVGSPAEGESHTGP